MGLKAEMVAEVEPVVVAYELTRQTRLRRDLFVRSYWQNCPAPEQPSRVRDRQRSWDRPKHLDSFTGALLIENFPQRELFVIQRGLCRADDTRPRSQDPLLCKNAHVHPRDQFLYDDATE